MRRRSGLRLRSGAAIQHPCELNSPINPDAFDTGQLCLSCGLCCNGVIFADVKLQPGDDAERLRSLGLPVSLPRSTHNTPRLTQPCAALDGCRCRVYSDRPKYCREFECALFKNAEAGRTPPATALRLVRASRGRAEKVRGLLRALADKNEEVSLGIRFRRVARRLQRTELDEETAGTYGQLTLAVHNLNLMVGKAFYPGGGSRET